MLHEREEWLEDSMNGSRPVVLKGKQMRRLLSKCVLALITVTLLVLTTSSAAASIVEYDLGIDGFGCPMCADSLEKRLEPLAGVENIEIDMGSGTAAFDVDGPEVLMPDEVAQAVDDANLSVRSIEVVAEGTLRQEDDEWRLELSEDESVGLEVDDVDGGLEDGDEGEVSGEAVEADDGWDIEVREVSTS